MQNKNVKGIIALALVTALSFGVILGSKQLAQNNGGNAGTAGTEEIKIVAELDVNGAENIEKAVQTENGYMVTVKTKGYVGDIVMNVSFDQNAQTITSVEVTEQSETENLGALIAEEEFLGQFAGAAAPVYLPGMTLEAETDKAKSENTETDKAEAVVLNDGTYKAEAAEEYNGYRDMMTMTVEGGRITSVVWDCVDADGNLKSVQSENGEYVMTEDGPIWKEQAEALAAALVKEQNLAFLAVNEEGKTDAVSGVSISVYGFISMAEECLKQASGEKAPVVLNDGEYEVKTTEADTSGFIEVVNMTVEGGKITSVVWDCVDAEGNKKSVMSENGQYVMTEDGPTWKEQADALGAAIVAGQGVDALGMNEEGKTDAVSGVSIYIGGFANLVEQCLAQASGEEVTVAGETTEETPEESAPQNGTLVDAVSGATVSSTAAVKGINVAYNFLQTVK